MSYGTGRPAILKDDESIWQCELLLTHPLTNDGDMHLVSAVELMVIRERVTNTLAPYDQPVNEHAFDILQKADQDFQTWYARWDGIFSQNDEVIGEGFHKTCLNCDSYVSSLLSTEPANPARSS
jgi:hypothetical protein